MAHLNTYFWILSWSELVFWFLFYQLFGYVDELASTEKGLTSTTMCLAIWIVIAFSLDDNAGQRADLADHPGLSFLFFLQMW